MGSYNYHRNDPIVPTTPVVGAFSDEDLKMLHDAHFLVNHQPLIWRGEMVVSERSRLEFEIETSDSRLEIYSLTLELERDEMTQGITVQWNILRPNYKRSTREWQQQMQEEQYAGDCSVTLMYKGLPVPGFTANILFQVTRLAEQHYIYMREVLKQQNEKVLYSDRGRTHELAVLTGTKTAAAARYDVVLAHYERLMTVLPDIFDQPHHELRRFVTVVPVNNMKALNHASLRLAARNGARWIPLTEDNPPDPVKELEGRPTPKPTSGNAPLSAWQQKLLLAQQKSDKARSTVTPIAPVKRALPSHVPLPRLEQSFDTYENRFLKMTVQKLANFTTHVKNQLEEELKVARREQERSSRSRALALQTRIKQNEAYIVNLKRMYERLRHSIHSSFMDKLSPLGPRRASVVLRENRYYRQIRLIEAGLEIDLTLSSSTVGLERGEKSVRLSSVNQLYEYWVTVVVLQTMVEKMGFTVVAKEGRSVNLSSFLARNTRFNYILQNGGSMELISPLGRRVVVYYNREYLSRDEQTVATGLIHYGYHQPTGMGSTKNRPDIAIEVFHEDERVPKIVVLDATYSRDPRTLYAKYQYRDSIRDFTQTDAQSGTPARPVVAAWVIYPDQPNRLEHDEFRFGQLPLQPMPEANEQMVPILRQLLKIAGAVE
ncbi:MAG: DUF2357 domain-containing protein [Chloroflexota bacterium]|nr:DUF2357 domain-containing protein [Chloroflexota bacterium]